MASSAPSLPDPSQLSWPGRVWFGARAALAGVGLTLAHRRLLVVAVVPMLVQAVLLIAFLALGVVFVAPAIERALATLSDGDGALHDVWTAVSWLIAGGLVVVGAFVGTILAGSVVCDPFYDVLSERTEALYTGRDAGPPLTVLSVVAGIGRELVVTLGRLAVWGAGAVPLWLLSFTPLAVVAAPLEALWTWLFLSYEYLSRSLARHSVAPGDRFRTLFSHASTFAGFGAFAALLSLVPFTAPFLVVGATRAYLALAAAGHVPSRLSDADRARLMETMK
jgi:CysZ protein